MADTLTTRPDPFLRDVLHGLSQTAKTIPSLYFYDERGSELFEQITQLPEYYPTRTEIALLSSVAEEVARTIGPEASIVEYGAGALRKIRLLLDALDRPAAYIPIDVSGEFLNEAASELQSDYPDLDIWPVIGSFMQPDLGIEHPEHAKRRVGFFPGSTLGNLDDQAVLTFLRQALDHLDEPNGFLLGVDINQNPETLIPAYNDAQGITAEFNLNLLTRINRELGADFDLAAFRHEARWNAERHRIEMHLISTHNQRVNLAGKMISFVDGESIHTENSRKFTRAMLDNFAEKSGWTVSGVWTSPEQDMGLFWLT